ncbi:MAG TPA: DUF4382 domain-containing protein [Candidatus Xenobia bacterium]|nr:DUF4382 domain-containing protein [Candidatus Xenobia bacterium]
MKGNPLNKPVFIPVVFLLVLAVVGSVILVSCGGGGMDSTTTSGGGGSNFTRTVTTTISDPPICEPPAGQFAHVWVTVTKVRAHLSSTADGSATGWVDLVDLTSAPKQIDLLGGSSTECILSTLGSVASLPAGKYQQIRIHLMANSAPGSNPVPSPNNCSPLTNVFNCVQLDDDNGPKKELKLSSQANTGIKIPPGQIAGGGLMLEADQTADINIMFNACLSIVEQGNGQFRLKPTLRAGEVTTSDTLTGKVVEVTDPMTGATGPLPSGAVVQVFLEDTSDPMNPKIIETIMTDASGNFTICPVPQPVPTGGFTIVATAIVPDTSMNAGVTATYNATVIFGVMPGTAIGDIGLIKEADPSTPAQIDGVLTTSPNTLSPVSFQLAALQEVTGPGGATKVIVPTFSLPDEMIESDSTAATDAMNTCPMDAPMGSICGNYTLFVPASNPRVGTTAPAGPPVNFFVRADLDPAVTCNVNTQTTAAIEVMAGMTANAPRLDFNTCAAATP